VFGGLQRTLRHAMLPRVNRVPRDGPATLVAPASRAFADDGTGSNVSRRPWFPSDGHKRLAGKTQSTRWAG